MKRKGKQGLNEIYVVGCGQSLKDFNWLLLRDKTTVSINGAINYVPNPDYFLTADSYLACRAAHCKFWDVDTYKVLVMNDDHKHYKRVARIVNQFDYHIKPARFNGDIGFTEDEFCTGQNSGFCGLQLAVILGAEKIHLLGMDFCGTGKGNFHHLYPSNPHVWDEFLANFTTALGVLKERGIEVINHSPISRLNGIIGYRSLYE